MFKRTNTYILSIKAKGILELIKGGITITEICEKYNILPEQVLAWKHEALKALIACFLTTSKIFPAIDDHRNPYIDTKQREYVKIQFYLK